MDISLSIVIPSYNSKKVIGNLLDSVIICSNENIEIIVVDDGSTDGSFSLIKEYAEKDKRIVPIHKTNGGVSSARNEGIIHVKGKYVWFIDADDIIPNGAVEKICEAIEEFPFDLCVFDFTAENVAFNKTEVLKSFESGEGFLLEKDANVVMEEQVIQNGTGNAVWNKIFKAEIIKENNIHFKEGITNGEDAIFLMDYYDKISNVKYIPDCLYYYIIHPESAVNNVKPGVFVSVKAAHESRMLYCEKYKLRDLQHRMKLDLIHCVFNNILNINGNKKIENKKQVIMDTINSLVKDEYICGEFKEVGVDELSSVLKTFHKLFMKKKTVSLYNYTNILARINVVKIAVKKLLKKG